MTEVRTRPHPIASVSDVVAYIDSRPAIKGRALVIWWLALGGLFLDAYANSALSAGLASLNEDLGLAAGQTALLTASASVFSLLFNPIGGWLADRYGRIPPLIAAKVLALAGGAVAALAPAYEIVVAGRVLVGAAYGIDFAIAMAVLAEMTPARFKNRLNVWQGVWYTAVSANLLLAIAFHELGAGLDIWRFSLGSAGVIAAVLLVLQLALMVESPSWLARKGRLPEAAERMGRIYGGSFEAAEPDTRGVPAAADRGMANVALLFRGTYLPRTVLAGTISVGQALQYFAVGWYLPIISLQMFGADFVFATLGTLVFNLFGIVGGFSAPAVGKRLGLRRASAIGFGVVFVILLLMGLTFDRLPLWAAFLLPSVFILAHSGGPGANGKSVSALSFRSELRATANGVIGALGSLGTVLGLFLFPLVQEAVGLPTTFLLVSVVPLVCCVICSAVKWEPTRAAVNPDEELDAPQFAR
ncbi:MFS transporter [Nocardiopsis potens]|uniref:MFS transporter n=1 Tax=Nocardiopsis potens TaxID=1246458 RepID=UPI00034770BA|nr:MFS transporter [Nocardiopsis potens]